MSFKYVFYSLVCNILFFAQLVFKNNGSDFPSSCSSSMYYNTKTCLNTKLFAHKDLLALDEDETDDGEDDEGHEAHHVCNDDRHLAGHSQKLAKLLDSTTLVSWN